MLIASHQLLQLVFFSMLLLQYYIFCFFSFHSLFENFKSILLSLWENDLEFTGAKPNRILDSFNY